MSMAPSPVLLIVSDVNWLGWRLCVGVCVQITVSGASDSVNVQGFGAVTSACPGGYLALMRYWARLMLAGVPVMVICRSEEPSMALAILICAPDIWRISFILVPCRPMMQPISWNRKIQRCRRYVSKKAAKWEETQAADRRCSGLAMPLALLFHNEYG